MNDANNTFAKYIKPSLIFRIEIFKFIRTYSPISVMLAMCNRKFIDKIKIDYNLQMFDDIYGFKVNQLLNSKSFHNL